ncbi:EcoAI/FtnUII family type I restriction enzme subunit R [Anaerolinea thermophila]|uniref:EcoAI/FtnUII family type I restriction enzme subunit R n=1 Tax=Anaerolinea thermophila TaxID=167964 RepID=UPI0026EFDE6A|nr:DEAD/DEAH box helicase family protein [Anaerolinea thermophila]
MPLNESDTRAQLIDPLLHRAGWTRSQVTREHYYRPDWQYAPGRVVLRGGRAEREKPRVMDYLLRYTDAFPIAVVEAKAEDMPANAGLEQAKRYARENNLMFAYATNGHEIIEWDGFSDTTRILTEFPSPDELWNRWALNTGIHSPQEVEKRIGELRPRYDAAVAAARQRTPLLHPYAPPSLTHGSEPRYFQEAAIRETLVRIMRGQRRILLTMATGTGKTFTAMQIVWKLIKSGWLHQQRGRSGKVLFLADREVLRNQAYNAFSPFAGDHGDPRFMLDGKRRLSLQHDLYFGIYQTLWAQDPQGKRLFEKFPRDFFDMVIIDEAHRSGFGTWKEILDHFESAIHLGMTATPKQDENVDTYAYFCAEEPAIPIDEQDPSKGLIHKPAYTYSLGQGIEDGFLATYKVHRVLSSVDKSGLRISQVVEQGAELIVPEDAELREEYHTPNFEREIRLPDRTQTLVKHLANLLRQFGPLHKTMVFCVDMEHAQEVARLLNNEFADLGLGENYAVPIVSEEGEHAQRWLNQFQDSDRRTPVVATTAELLSTGVDVPACRNIVFLKTISSPILFKQIIGRGSRLDPATGKLWFRIIDYTNATRLLDPRWDCPPRPIETARPISTQTGILQGTVRLADSGEILQGASVAVMAAPNDQRGPILTDEQGKYRFEGLPVGEVTVVAYGPRLKRQQKTITTQDGVPVTVDFDLAPLAEGEHRQIVVRNLEVTIAEEATFFVAGLSEPLTLEQYVDYSRQKTLELLPGWELLVQAWQEENQRQEIKRKLEHSNVYPEVLAEVLNQQQADTFDVLAYVAFGRQPIPTREERLRTFVQRHADWLNAFSPLQRQIIAALLEQYRNSGVDEIANPRVFRLPAFRTWGGLNGISQQFGGDQSLRQIVLELQRRLYP